MEGKVEVQVAVEGSWRAGRETGVFAWLVGWLRRLRGRERTRRHGRGAGLDQLVVGRAESLGEVGDGGEALGVERGQAECGAPDEELQHHFEFSINACGMSAADRQRCGSGDDGVAKCCQMLPSVGRSGCLASRIGSIDGGDCAAACFEIYFTRPHVAINLQRSRPSDNDACSTPALAQSTDAADGMPKASPAN